MTNRKKTYLTATVTGELYLGAYRSANPEKHLKEVEEFVIRSSVLPLETATSKYYGMIKTGLLRKGKPIPENDIWIAASAMEHNLQLVARDKHFEEIDGLKKQLG